MMNRKTRWFLLAVTILSAWNVVNGQEPQSRDSTVEAAAKKQEELARMPRITVEELKYRVSRNEATFILDVRMPDDYDRAEKKIKGSVRISPFELKTRMSEVPRDKDVVAYCT